MGQPKIVGDGTFDAEVLGAASPVLVDFWAAWCGPCRMIAPIVEEMAHEYAGTMDVAKVDVDANPRVARRYGILSIPTLGIFSGGEMVERIVGFMPKGEMKRRVDKALAGLRAPAL